MEDSLGTLLPLYSAIPFVGMLLSIALGPVLAPHFWHHHFGKVSAVWAILVAIPLIIAYGGEGIHELLTVIIVDYIPFIVLLGALFTVSGGILLRTTLKGTPLINVIFLLVGAALSSIMGTTGSAALMIRPFIRINKHRKNLSFMVVFFIFIVANAGGSLTPLGDPPLFLGFLHGVPFFWTMKVLPIFITVLVLLIAIYYAFDTYYLRKELKEQGGKAEAAARITSDSTSGKTLEILGLNNIVLLIVVVGVILFSGSVKMSEISILGVHVGMQDLIRNIALVAVMVVSWVTTSKALRQENEYSWDPILEVAYLFFGIFLTMAPVLAILKAGEAGALGFITAAVKEPTHYFWVTGALSSFLDNAPTYLTFFNTALGQFYPGMAEPEAVALLLAEHPAYLLAISAGAVFFGANTYIGNAPNFMVRSIAEEAGVTMPSFFGYMKYSICILLPIFLLVTFIFF